MKIKFFTAFAALLLFSGLCAFAQMSDSQVIDYVKEAVENGKSKKQIAGELMAKGVSTAQINRLMQAYQSGEYGNPASPTPTGADAGISGDRTRSQEPIGTETKTKKGIESVEIQNKMVNPLDDSLVEETAEEGKVRIFGHDIFTKKNLSFEPNENAATPSNYVIGPGDELLIDIWGENEASLKYKVTPEGNVTIPQIGPVQLSGLTISKATAKLKTILSRKYSLGGDNPGSNISVTLANIRTVKVNILGEVATPGTYRLSSFSTIFNALYHAGGITEIGSLRNIKLVRNGKTVDTADLYRFIFTGTRDGSATLCDGDAIIVPTYTSIVKVSGGVKRPMYYEAAKDETVAKILEYAGGFSHDGYSGEVVLHRRDGEGGKAFSVLSSQFSSFSVQDGDRIVVNQNKHLDLIDNSVKISGAVVRPGEYAIGGNVATLKQLVLNAGGLLEEAFTNRAQIIREKPDRSMEVIAVPLGEILSGRADDVILRKNDIVMISDKNQMEPKGDVSVTGFVNNPGDFKYAEGMTIEDIIMLAGGLESGASTMRVEVSRRIIDSSSLTAKDTVATVYTFELRKDFNVQPDAKFTLQPFDVVSVRKSPTYEAQSRVLVSGEVTFPGEYTLLTNHDRLSDIFRRVGAATPNAYVQGAILRRTMTDAERRIRKITKKTTGRQAKTDTLQLDSIPDFYSVGINLEKAVAKPGSNYDVVLRDGDELIIPTMSTTVSIQGEVFYPNVVNYVEGQSVAYYIDLAGGLTTRSKRNKVFVVYMNGKVARGMSAKVTPGCEIVVPRKEEGHKLTAGEWIGIGTSAASLATMIVSLMNMIKK